MKKNSKSSILEKGSAIIHEKGFNNTGIKEILEAAGVPKGSFYYFFESKEDFGLELVTYYYETIDGMMERHFTCHEKKALHRLESFFEEYVKCIVNRGLTGGCPLGNMAQEMSDINEKIRLKLDVAFETMRARIQEMIELAKLDSSLNKNIDSKKMARFILNSWEGALMDVKLSKEIDALEIFRKMIFEVILKSEKN